MPRKKTKALIRDIQPDRVYESVMVQKVINRVMQDGKKQTAEKLVYDGMEKAAKKLKVENPLDVLIAFKNIQPHVETRSRRVGGANYQIPLKLKVNARTTSLSCGLLPLLVPARYRHGRPYRRRTRRRI